MCGNSARNIPLQKWNKAPGGSNKGKFSNGKAGANRCKGEFLGNRGSGYELGQEYAHKVHESTLARFNENLEYIKTTRVKRDIQFKWYDYSRKKQHIVHIITNMSGDHFTHDKFDAVDKTPNQLRVEEEEAEHKRWLEYSKTDEYKQEQAERAQERRDLATHMGENGYTSFVANDDGTYTTWR